MAQDLSDAAILKLVKEAMRKVGEGKASVMAAGEDLMRELLDVPHCGRPLHQDDGA
jgi:hypothetical protein